MKPLVKKKLTKQQDKFLTEMLSNGGNVKEAMEIAKYHPSSRSHLMASMKDELIERAKISLAGSTVKSVKRIEEALDADGTIPTSQMELRMKAAADILDRAGISKRQEIDIKGEIIHGVVLLPPKKEVVLDHVG